MNEKQKNDDRTLVLLDTDRIHDFVFSTNKLKEIRGASTILNELNLVKTKEIMKKHMKDETGKIFLGGGSGKFIFEDMSHAHNFCKEIEDAYRLYSAGEASITTAVVPYDDNAFVKSLYNGEKELRRNKDFKCKHVQLLSDHYFMMCESNGMLPAEFKIKTPEDKQPAVSYACSKKIENSKDGKNSFFEEFVNYIEKAENTSLQEKKVKNNWCTVSKNNLKRLLPEDINSIGDYSNGYVGLIYADGNRMGQKLQKLESKDDYATFSKDILKSTKSAIFEALAKNLKLEHQFPFEILLLGGDDLLLIVPADKAIEITIDFCDKFKSNLKKHNLSISAGVVITHANYPIHQMIDYGEQLLKSAKKKGNEFPNEETNYIDFMVIKNPIQSKVFDMRINEMIYKSEDNRELRLFQRPYTTEQLSEIVEKIRTLKYEGKFPRSRLKQMYQSLFRGKNQAMLDYCMLISRLDKDCRTVMMEEFFECCDLFPWQSTTDGLETPFLDVIELYDYITKEKA